MLRGLTRRALGLLQGRLSVNTQPSATASSGIALAVQPAFNALGNGGAVQANYTGAVTVSASGGPVLSGTATVNAVAGVATFTNLALTGAGTATLAAAAADRTGVSTTSITVT